jgi:hypothetical protein
MVFPAKNRLRTFVEKLRKHKFIDKKMNGIFFKLFSESLVISLLFGKQRCCCFNFHPTANTLEVSIH